MAAVLISGACWFAAYSLSGRLGFLMWLAPVPVLLVSYHSSAKTSFLAAFAAYLIGRLSWYHYLLAVISLVPTLLFLVSFSLVFALIILINRRILLQSKAWYALFPFPVFFTFFEWVLLKFAPDGTAGSIAYSQMDNLPVIQIAAITGMLGITFLLTLVPAGLAMTFHFRRSKEVLLPVSIITGLAIAASMLFGCWRLGKETGKETMVAGMAVLSEKYHHISDSPNIQEEAITAKAYATAITLLAQEGAQVVLLPERAININSESELEIMSLLSATAKQNKLWIIFGFTNLIKSDATNSAIVLNGSGEICRQYDKVHLVKVLEDKFKAGNKTGNFEYNKCSAGLAICKDMDFPGYVKEYGGVSFMAVPAWDFVVDGWLHGRMAILRGVENGFSIVRTARQGRLTISDCFGRLSTERDCSGGNPVQVVGNVSLHREKTVYAHFGDWFGVLNVVAVLFFMFLWLRSVYLRKPALKTW